MQTQRQIGKKPAPPERIKDLGYLNSWADDIPEIVTKCWNSDPEHEREHYDMGRCVRMVVCRKCNFLYKVDSSD